MSSSTSLPTLNHDTRSQSFCNDDMPQSLCGDTAPEARQVVARLGEQIRGIQSTVRRTGPVISSGSTTLDRCMPHGGFLGGTILELTTPHGLPVGATSIALNIAKHAVESEPESGSGTINQRAPMAGKYVVVIEPPAPYYPPALEHLGLPLERVIGLRPSNYADLLWSLDQALRCPAVGCVIAHIDRLDDRAARRLQLATEIGGDWLFWFDLRSMCVANVVGLMCNGTFLANQRHRKHKSHRQITRCQRSCQPCYPPRVGFG